MVKFIFIRTVGLIVFSALIFLFLSVDSHSTDYQQVTGLIDLRTTFSDGAHDLGSLVKMAKEKGFEVLVINDHDRMVMEYGLPPFRNIVKKRIELNSINKKGAKSYLDAISDIQKRYPDMIIIPGSETVAFYYWTGSPFRKNLTAHNYERRILTIGMEKPKDYENLPILHNGSSAEYIVVALPCILLFFGSLVASIFLIRWKGVYRIAGIIIFILSVAFIINVNPFRYSPFDQYHGDQGISPYQLLIDYVNSNVGMTFLYYLGC